MKREKMPDLDVVALFLSADVIVMSLIYYLGKKPIEKKKTEVGNED